MILVSIGVALIFIKENIVTDKDKKEENIEKDYL